MYSTAFAALLGLAPVGALQEARAAGLHTIMVACGGRDHPVTELRRNATRTEISGTSSPRHFGLPGIAGKGAGSRAIALALYGGAHPAEPQCSGGGPLVAGALALDGGAHPAEHECSATCCFMLVIFWLLALLSLCEGGRALVHSFARSSTVLSSAVRFEVVMEHLDRIVLARVAPTVPGGRLEVGRTAHDAGRPCSRSTCGLSMLCGGGAGSVNAVFMPLFTPSAGGGSAILWPAFARTSSYRDAPKCSEIHGTSPCRWRQRRRADLTFLPRTHMSLTSVDGG